MGEIIKLDGQSEEYKAIKSEWFAKAKQITSADELQKFADHLFEDYEHDYGTSLMAVSALVTAAAWYGTNVMGLTALQATFIKWNFMANFEFQNNKCGLKLMDFDNMLYPWFDYKFDNVIPEERFKKLQEQAKLKMDSTDKDSVNEEVWNHWESIVNGQVPFGWRLEEKVKG